jgi:hypothetical protein
VAAALVPGSSSVGLPVDVASVDLGSAVLGSVDFGSIDFGSVDSVDFDSVDSVDFDSVDSVDFGSVRKPLYEEYVSRDSSSRVVGVCFTFRSVSDLLLDTPSIVLVALPEEARAAMVSTPSSLAWLISTVVVVTAGTSTEWGPWLLFNSVS